MSSSDNFLQKHARALGFLVSVLSLIALASILIKRFSILSNAQIALTIVLMLIMAVCAFAQARLYQVPGYKFDLFTLPGIILGCLFIYFG